LRYYSILFPPIPWESSVAEPAAGLVEHTTSLALQEKKKLIKSLRRFDLLLFLVCAIVGLDTLGQVSSYGAQTFTWVIILAVAFLFPYALVIAELGSAFTQEGGPYEWMKLAWGRLVAGSGRGRRCRGRSGAGGRRGRRPGRGRCRRRRRG